MLLIRRNVLLNLAGQVLPMAVALPCIPFLLRQIGVERFGLLTMIWALLGSFGLLDLGISRSLTQLTAARIGEGREKEIPSLAWTSFAFLLVLGLLGTILLAAGAGFLVDGALSLRDPLRGEMLKSCYWVAAAMPVLLFTMGFRGLLEGRQRFDLVTWVRLPLGISTYAAPLLVLPFRQDLPALVLTLLAVRFLACAVLGAFALRDISGLSRDCSVRKEHVRPLLRFGGWMSITSLAGTFLTGLDKFFIGAIIPVSRVAYYTTPFEMITKLWIIPWSVAGAIFPEFARRVSADPMSAAHLLLRGMRYTAGATFPVLLLLMAFAEEGLSLWLGPEIGARSADILRWLAAAMLLNVQSQLLLAFMQGIGRPGAVAKLNLLELPAYLGALWFLLRSFGVEGAAMAWFAFAVADFLALLAMTRNLGRIPLPTLTPVATALGAMALGMALLAAPLSLPFRVAIAAALLAAHATWCWRVVLDAGMRDRVLGMIRRV